MSPEDERVRGIACALDDELDRRNEHYGLDNWSTEEVVRWVLDHAEAGGWKLLPPLGVHKIGELSGSGSDRSGEVRAPVFGEWFTGIYASDDNPKKHGRYVRTVRRRSRMNPGTFYELTDGHGRFWQYPVESIVRRFEITPDDGDEDGWRDYDHGFRDGYQAALREGRSASSSAVGRGELGSRGVQHASMAALREAVQRSKETP